MKKISILALATLPAFTLSAITWDGGGGDGLWNTPENWDTDAVPTSSDDVFIDNATVTINAPALAAELSLGNSGSSTVTLNVNSTLNYDSPFDSEDWGVAGDTVIVNINNGGVINGGGDDPSSTASRIAGTATVNIFAGGSLTNVYRQRIDPTIDLTGGEFVLYTDDSGGRLGSYSFNNGTIGGSSGTITLALGGNGVNTTIGGGSTSNMAAADLTFQFEVINGYVPQIGDSFDFFGSTGTADLGDGTNIASLTKDGNWDITWDTSQWTPGGNQKGQLTIADVTAIPEPSFYAALLGVIALIAVRRRK